MDQRNPLFEVYLTYLYWQKLKKYSIVRIVEYHLQNGWDNAIVVANGIHLQKRLYNLLKRKEPLKNQFGTSRMEVLPKPFL